MVYPHPHESSVRFLLRLAKTKVDFTYPLSVGASTMSLQPSDTTPGFAGAIYFAALVLIVSNFFDLGATIWPFRPGTPEWRYGAIGLTGGFLLTPLLGIVVAMIVAASRKQWVGMLVFTIPGLVIGAGVLLMVPFFLLDTIQVRSSVNPDMMGPFQFGAGKALFKLVTGGAAMLWCGIVGLRWVLARRREQPSQRAGRKGAQEGLIVGG